MHSRSAPVNGLKVIFQGTVLLQVILHLNGGTSPFKTLSSTNEI